MTNTILAWLVTLIAFFIILVILIFWFWMLADCIHKKFKHKRSMIEWFIIIIFVPILGAVLYYFLVKVKHDKLEKRRK
jgi:hypothetical protein